MECQLNTTYSFRFKRFIQRNRRWNQIRCRVIAVSAKTLVHHHWSSSIWI